MNSVGAAFQAFVREVDQWSIYVTGALADFERKQRMIERAAAHAIMEAYRHPEHELWKIDFEPYLQGIEECERVMRETSRIEETLQHHGLLQARDSRHRAEILQVLYSNVCSHLEARRNQYISTAAALAAVILSLAAVVISIWRA